MNKKLFFFGLLLFILGFSAINSNSVQNYIFDLISYQSSGIISAKTDQFYSGIDPNVPREMVDERVNQEANLRIDEYTMILLYTGAFTLIFCGITVMLLSLIIPVLKRKV